MPKIDVSGLGIRVVLDRRFYEEPRRNAPLDVEGTVLTVATHSKHGTDMAKNGRAIELILAYDYNGVGDVLIRWDNDTRDWFTTGCFLLRRAKVGFCMTIWKSNNTIPIDDRPFSELRPEYWSPLPSLFHSLGYSGTSKWKTYTTTFKAQTAYNEEAIYGEVQQVPYDGQWYKCVHQGVLSWARRLGTGFEWREDIDGAILHYIDDHDLQQAIGDPAPPPAPHENLWTGPTTYGNTTGELNIVAGSTTEPVLVENATTAINNNTTTVTFDLEAQPQGFIDDFLPQDDDPDF